MTVSTDLFLGLPPATAKILASAEQFWYDLRCPKQSELVADPVVYWHQGTLGSLDADVILMGGTLGILVGAVLVHQGWRVMLWERGVVRGRVQEWNISRAEMQVFLDLGLLSDLESIIASEYNPARVQFAGGDPLWVRDVLNVGVDPVALIAQIKAHFLAGGGQILEHTPLGAVHVYEDGIQVQSPTGTAATARLLIDAMGHRSPIVAQARGGSRPEGVCLVVGGCAQGIPNNETGDLIYTFTPIEQHCQPFWEAFPARDGRTTYLFTYVDPDPRQLSLLDCLRLYRRWLPDYQGVAWEELIWQRFLVGCFPAYRRSPLSGLGNRILFVGDSSGQQSPLSFGGFGAMCRHLQRLTAGIDQALKADALEAGSLKLLQPYQPDLAVAWLFQQTMRVPVDQPYDPDQINRLLRIVFQTMAGLGEATLKPFLQDTIQFVPLAKTLAAVTAQNPSIVAKLIPQVGLGTLLSWLKDFAALGILSVLPPAPLTSQDFQRQHRNGFRWQ